MASPNPKKERERFDFSEAVKFLIEGKRITKLEWGSDENYGILYNGHLMINLVRDNMLHDWIITDGDLHGDDYVLVEDYGLEDEDAKSEDVGAQSQSNDETAPAGEPVGEEEPADDEADSTDDEPKE